MAEYIERDAAIDAIMKVYVITAGYKARNRVFAAEEAVHQLPVADVAPVVHGRWEFLGPNMLNRGCMCGTCSACKVRCEYIVNTGLCPNCGAKMEVDNG